MSGQREVDLLASFAFPLPITVICELLGVPVKDRDDFRKWSATIVSNTAAPGVFEADATAMIRYFMALLAAKRQEPADDLLSALISARDQGDRLRENELVSMVFLLLVARHETTVNLIASGMLALSSNASAPLARLEAEIAFSHLLARFGSMRLAVPAESLRWRPSTLIHGLESLPVRLVP